MQLLNTIPRKLKRHLLQHMSIPPPYMTPPPDKCLILELPTEIRLIIYSYLIGTGGRLDIYGKREIANAVDQNTSTLMHINHQLRNEVQEFFYKTHIFNFRSLTAADNFLLRIGREGASMIKSVEFTQHAATRMTPSHITSLFTWLNNVECLKIACYNRTLYSDNTDGTRGFKALASAICRASEKLARGKAWQCSKIKRGQIWWTRPMPIMFIFGPEGTYLDPLHHVRDSLGPNIGRLVYNEVEIPAKFMLEHKDNKRKTSEQIETGKNTDRIVQDDNMAATKNEGVGTVQNEQDVKLGGDEVALPRRKRVKVRH